MPRSPGWGKGLAVFGATGDGGASPGLMSCSSLSSFWGDILSLPPWKAEHSPFPPALLVLHTLTLLHFWNHCDFQDCGYKTRPSLSSVANFCIAVTSKGTCPGREPGAGVGRKGCRRDGEDERGDAESGWRGEGRLQRGCKGLCWGWGLPALLLPQPLGLGTLLGRAGRGHPKAPPAGLQCTESLYGCHVQNEVSKAFLFEDLWAEFLQSYPLKWMNSSRWNFQQLMTAKLARGKNLAWRSSA